MIFVTIYPITSDFPKRHIKIQKVRHIKATRPVSTHYIECKLSNCRQLNSNPEV